MRNDRPDHYLPTEGPLFKRGRPYDGQPHTDTGKRGEFTLIPGDMLKVIWREDRPAYAVPITLRDIYDAMLIGILHAKNREDPRTHETLPVDQIETTDQLWAEFNKDLDFDPIAAAQNACVEVEKRLGIYPNVPEVEWNGTNDG